MLCVSLGSIAEAQSTSAVNIESSPAGATVYIDGADVPLGTTPLARVKLRNGEHALRFTLAGYAEATLQINVQRDDQTFTTSLSALAAVVINHANDGTRGAAVRIDGKPAGNVPTRATVQPGRHLVQVGKRGYITFSQWIDIVGGQVITLPVALDEQAPQTGSILVHADVTGAPVFIDGQQRGGTPVVVEGLAAGDHVVEIRPEAPGQQAFTRVVRVIVDRQTDVEARVLVAADRGSLRVIVNVPGAMVALDGEDIGSAPASKQDLAPGDHVVTARAEGYEPVEQIVSVVEGRERVVSLRLQPRQTAGGQIVVRADASDAMVTIDGTEVGAPPLTWDAPAPGSYAVVIRAKGRREVRRTCRVDPTQSCFVDVELNRLGSPVRIEANVPGAELIIDDAVRGPVPWEGDVAIGGHEIEVRAAGYRTHTERVEVRASKSTRLIEVTLQREKTTEGGERDYRQIEESARNAVSHGGAVLSERLTTLDLSLGWPYMGELRLSTAIIKWVDVGVAIRTFGRLTDFEARAKLGYQPVSTFSAGVQMRLGGGIGPRKKNNLGDRRKTNSFLYKLEGIASLHFGRAGVFSVWGAYDFSSDRWDFQSTNRDVFLAGAGRQKVSRARVGGALELIMNRRWNLWFLAEGIVKGGGRRIFGDIFGAGKGDPKMYGQVGLTHKFGRVGAQ